MAALEPHVKQFINDIYFPYYQTSYFLHILTMNMYLQRHLTYLQVNEEIFTVRKVVDHISKYHKIFGYKTISVQNSIRELETSGLITTEKKGRDKFFLKLPEPEFNLLMREGILEGINRLIERISEFFTPLDEQKQQILRQLLRTTKFWEIIHGDTHIEFRHLHRSQTLQNMQILNFIEKDNLLDLPVLKDLHELSNNYGNLLQPIVLRNPLIGDQEPEIPVLSIEQLIASPTIAKIFDRPINDDLEEIKNQVYKMKAEGRFLEAINLLSHPGIIENPTIQVQQVDLYYFLTDITKFKSKLDALLNNDFQFMYDFSHDDQNTLHCLYLEYLLMSRKMREIEPYIRKVESKPNYLILKNYPETYSRYLITKAKWELELGKYENATALAYEGLDMSESIDHNLEIVRALSLLGVINSRGTNFDAAFSYYKKAKDLATESKLVYELAIITVRLGNLQWRAGNYEEAINMANLARKTLERVGSKEYLAKVYSNMGLAYRRLGKTEEAIFYINRGVEMAKKIGLEEVYYMGLMNLVSSYADMMMLQVGQRIIDTLDHDDRFQDLIKVDGRMSVHFYDRYAHLMLRTGNFKEALKLHHKRSEIALAYNDKKRIIKTQMDIAETYRLRGDIIAAKKIYDSIDIEETKKANIQYYIILLMSLANINSSLKNPNEGLRLIKECHELVQTIGNSAQMMETLSIWFMLEMISGNEPKSQELFLEMNKLRQLEDSESVELQYLRAIISILEKQQYPRVIEEILTESAYQKISLMSKVAYEYSSILKLQRLKLITNRYYSKRTKEVRKISDLLFNELYEHANINSNELLKVELIIIKAYLKAIDSETDEYLSTLSEAANKAQSLGLLRLYDEILIKQERFKNLQKRGQTSELAISLQSAEFELSGINEFLKKELDTLDFMIDQDTIS
ncbi:MAG: hypothetical protein HeimC2_21500 [Candidatus Heimdallarchaeota archaeon LC_2]|nr:MAG: hypothetical protein HeimC2_21500 [Candidatus Heimdallarchaeota archaeon LC_2]